MNRLDNAYAIGMHCSSCFVLRDIVPLPFMWPSHILAIYVYNEYGKKTQYLPEYTVGHRNTRRIEL